MLVGKVSFNNYSKCERCKILDIHNRVLKAENKVLRKALMQGGFRSVRELTIDECAKVAYKFCPETLGLNHKCSEAIKRLKRVK
jgi:hypothetical protein